MWAGRDEINAVIALSSGMRAGTPAWHRDHEFDQIVEEKILHPSQGEGGIANTCLSVHQCFRLLFLSDRPLRTRVATSTLARLSLTTDVHIIQASLEYYADTTAQKLLGIIDLNTVESIQMKCPHPK